MALIHEGGGGWLMEERRRREHRNTHGNKNTTKPTLVINQKESRNVLLIEHGRQAGSCGDGGLRKGGRGGGVMGMIGWVDVDDERARASGRKTWETRRSQQVNRTMLASMAVVTEAELTLIHP